MRTTLDLDDDLMDRLLAQFPDTSKTKAVELAIEGYLAREAGRALLELGGAFPDMVDVSEENKRLEVERFERLERLWNA